MDSRNINNVQKLIRIRDFLRRSGDVGELLLTDNKTKEQYRIGGQKWGGGSTTSQYSEDYIVGRFLQEVLDRDVMYKIITVMTEGGQKIDEYLNTLGVATIEQGGK